MADFLSAGEQRCLLRVAREHLEARVRRRSLPPVLLEGPLALPGGAFVSLHRHGQLRGCLGRVEADQPLAHTVAYLAAVVADQDYRFEPVTVLELEALTIEISVLTPPVVVADVQRIEVGRHGLIVEHGRSHGLLLPQVALQHGWDRETFLSQTCVKAGLAPHAWRTGARVLAFEAQVFSEERPTST